MRPGTCGDRRKTTTSRRSLSPLRACNERPPHGSQKASSPRDVDADQHVQMAGVGQHGKSPELFDNDKRSPGQAKTWSGVRAPARNSRQVFQTHPKNDVREYSRAGPAGALFFLLEPSTSWGTSSRHALLSPPTVADSSLPIVPRFFGPPPEGSGNLPTCPHVGSSLRWLSVGSCQRSERTGGRRGRWTESRVFERSMR